MSTEVFRLRVGTGNQSGNGSSGDWRLYEGREEFEKAVLSALIEAAAHGQMKPLNWPARWWHQHVMRGGKEVEHREWTVRNVYAAEQLIDGEWVDLGAVLVPPSVRFATEPAARTDQADEAAKDVTP